MYRYVSAYQAWRSRNHSTVYCVHVKTRSNFLDPRPITVMMFFYLPIIVAYNDMVIQPLGLPCQVYLSYFGYPTCRLIPSFAGWKSGVKSRDAKFFVRGEGLRRTKAYSRTSLYAFLDLCDFSTFFFRARWAGLTFYPILQQKAKKGNYTENVLFAVIFH